MDIKALFSLSYGLYLASAKDGARDVGCITNTVTQVSNAPILLAFSLNKNNFTTECIKKTGKVALSVLTEGTPPSVFGTFGYQTGRHVDKFAEVAHVYTPSGLAVPAEHVAAVLEGHVHSQIDCNTHLLFLAELTDARVHGNERPMTYAYYHDVIKGLTPRNAPTYVEPQAVEKTYTCSLCGYAYPGTAAEFESLPETYTCPVCGVPKDMFELK